MKIQVKLMRNIKYAGNVAHITYEEDGVTYTYSMVNERGNWTGEDPDTDVFFRSLLKKGDINESSI